MPSFQNCLIEQGDLPAEFKCILIFLISFFQDEKRQILKMSGWLTVVGIKVYHCYQYMLKKTSKAVTINWYENKRLYPDMPGKGFSQFTQEEQIIKIKMDVFLQLTSTDYVKVIFDTGGFMFNKEVPNILLFLLLFFFIVFFLCVCFCFVLFVCYFVVVFFTIWKKLKDTVLLV